MTKAQLQPVIGERLIDVNRESAIIVQWPWQRIRRQNRVPCPGPAKSKFEAPWRHIKVEQLANGRREWMKNPDSDSTGERESGKLGIKFTRTDYFSGAAGVVRESYVHHPLRYVASMIRLFQLKPKKSPKPLHQPIQSADIAAGPPDFQGEVDATLDRGRNFSGKTLETYHTDPTVPPN